MSESKKEINVKLSDELEYDYQGDKKQAEFITLKKPTARNVHLTSIIKSSFQNAAMEISKQNESERKEIEKNKSEEFELEPEEAMQLLFAVPDGVEKCMIAFKELLRDVALIDGEIKATVPLIDSLSVDDFENIFGKYLINFILASLLEKTNKV